VKEDEDVWNPLDVYTPNMIQCPHCNNDVVPVVEYKMGLLPPLVTCFMLMTWYIYCLSGLEFYIYDYFVSIS
jgi:hypothetical protein